MQTTDRKPVAGLQALLGNSLDYAGLFPPANLPLDQAVKNYARYRFGPDAWFLSRFVCPVNRLNELDPYTPLFAKSAPLAVSALALPSSTWKDLIRSLDESLALVFGFVQEHAPRVCVDAIEITLPADLTQAVGRVEVRDLVPAAAESIELSGLGGVTPFFEVTAPDWDFQALNAIRWIAKHNAGWKGLRCGRAAFKLRTGGLKPEAFPTVNQLAFVIQTCLRAGVKFKCTAGLHHPVRRYDESVATRMHGFLNILGAAALFHAHVLYPSDFDSILTDEDASNFRFDENGFAWNDVQATVEQVSEARRDLIVSFGSCSFEEPLEDLQELRIL